MENLNRRRFLAATGYLTGGTILAGGLNADAAAIFRKKQKVKISGHIWVYASKFPPPWDSTPVIEQAFSDFQYAGIDGMELMEVNLRHNDAVAHLKGLIQQYKVPVTGTSYGASIRYGSSILTASRWCICTSATRAATINGQRRSAAG